LRPFFEVFAVIDAPTYSRLQNAIRREGRSLLQYADDSSPYADDAVGRRLIAEIQRLAARERDANTALGRLLVKHRLSPPWLGAYPSGFTSFNFLAVRRLLPLLADYQRRGLAELEADVAATANADARAALHHVLDEKKATLARLDELLKPAADGAPPDTAGPPPAAAKDVHH
jgi:hypothetical protein